MLIVFVELYGFKKRKLFMCVFFLELNQLSTFFIATKLAYSVSLVEAHCENCNFVQFREAFLQRVLTMKYHFVFVTLRKCHSYKPSPVNLHANLGCYNNVNDCHICMVKSVFYLKFSF